MGNRIVLALVVVVAAEGLAHADEPRRAVRLAVTAPPSCTDETRFGAALARRSDKLLVAPGAEDTIDVRIEEDTSGFTGTLVVTRANGASAPRSLEGATCEEVVRGLSLVAALVFDPEAKLDPPAVAPASPPPRSPRPPDADRAVSPASAAPWRFGAGGGAAVWALGGDGTAIAAAAFAEIARDRAGLSPLVRVGFARATFGATTTSATFGPVAADLSLSVARASLCVVRWDLGLGLRVRPCVAIDAGVLAGAPKAPVTGEGRSRGWVAPSATLRIEWEIERTFFLEAEGGAGFPLVRDEIGAEPRFTIYRAPPAVPAASLSAGLRFP